MLAQYAQSIRRRRRHAVRMVATSATRDASNAAEFVHGVVDILGVPPEVISGEEEAWLSFTGATGELASPAGQDGLPPPYLVVDIGGGSTEFVVGGDGADPRGVSMDIGCVRLTERHLHSDPPTADEVAAATADIDAAIDSRRRGPCPSTSRQTLVGLAGSVTTVAAIALGLPEYDAGPHSPRPDPRRAGARGHPAAARPDPRAARRHRPSCTPAGSTSSAPARWSWTGS